MARQSLLHHLVAERAAQFSDAVAVMENGRRTTYRDIDTNSRRLMSHLRDRGIGAGRVVGVCLPPGAALATALLAVRMAGAAAVLLEADLRRAHRLAETTGLDTILTADPVPDAAPILTAPPGTGTIRLDDRWERFLARSTTAEDTPGEPTDPALISDGDTELVLDAEAVTDYACRLAEHCGLTESDAVVVADTADAPTRHAVLFATLITGATLIAVPGDPAAPPEHLLRTMARQRATLLCAAPRTLHETAHLPEWADCGDLRLVLCSTPGLDSTAASDACQRIAERTPAVVRSIHGAADYGCAVASHTFAPGEEAAPVALDRSAGRLRIEVRDELGQPVPPGVPGELHLAGAVADHGFLGRPELTARCFVPDASGKPGDRIHRTGDLVRIRNDGSLEHLGRLADPARPEPLSPFAPELLEDSAWPEYVEPRTDEERAVAAVWSELLEVDDIGALDNFFQLGGYSLLLTRLTERLHQATGKLIDLPALYSAVTVEAQAELIRTARTGDRLITTVPRDGALPLSPGQRRLWFLDNADPGSPEWIVPLFLRLTEDTSPDTVRRALDVLAERHESLRTRYVLHDGEPAQVIDAPAPVELSVLDCPPHDLRTTVRARFEETFDLAAGPLWRALLLNEPGSGRLLFITVHHIACDGWSATVLEREFRDICAALQAGRTPELPAPPVQYADWAVWQRGTGTADGDAAGLEFWQRELDGLTGTELPADRPRPAERDPRGGLVAVTVPAPLADRLLSLGQRHEASPFMTVLAGFATLLARYTGQWDIGVGVPVAGRDRPETGSVVGFFLNSLVLRCRLDPGLRFLDALDRVRATSLAAFAHQDVSFDRLIEELHPERDPSRTPLYQVAFNFNDEQVTGGMPGETDRDLFLGSRQVAKTDLTLYLRRDPDGTLTGVLEYATALFEHATVERLASHFVRLLASIANAPDSTLSALQIMPDGELGELLAEGNDTETQWQPGSVIDLIEAQAAATPDATALVTGPRRVSYRELDRAANRIAHRLRALGAGPDRLVGVCLDRGPELVQALLGVWKAGAAYVPLDPSNPPERLNHLLSDSGAPILVSTSALTDLTAEYAGTRLLLDDEDEHLAEQPDGPLPRPADPELLAYVIYTSGSTGTPKGVMVTHLGLANHLKWAARRLVRGDGGAPLFSSVAFDLPATNLYTPLITGRPVHLLPAGLDLARLADELTAAAPYSFVKLTPGHLELLTHRLTPQQIDGLADVVLVAGEALPARIADHWHRAMGPGRLINEYGPTETSIGTTVFPVDAPSDGTVPLGRPLPNTTAYVLDETGRPVPAGVPGELYVGGLGVARGYLNRPAPTAERFVPDPYGPPGSRLYRTGDRVRRLPDGSIGFLGRTDNQVKIRGYRVEPGEIETRLTAQPGIRDAVVVLHEDPGGEKTLTAYLVPAPGTEIDADAVRRRLSDTLPAYLVPARYQTIEAVPLTSNGKVDHRALPAVEPPGDAHEPPSTPLEERIAAIWAALLGRERIGVEDSFFTLGGHSILAIRMTSSLQDEFDIDISVRSVLENPTVRLLAQAVEARIRAEIEQMSETELLEAKSREHLA